VPFQIYLILTSRRTGMIVRRGSSLWDRPIGLFAHEWSSALANGSRFRLRVVPVVVSTLSLGAALLVGANVVVADSVQVQSYERDSQAAECPNQPWETPWQANWGPDASWKPSWEQWANNGTGGWTCTRTIVWAKSSGPGATAASYDLGDIGPGGGLVFLKSAGVTYEMAPKNWSGAMEDPSNSWCNVNSNATGAAGTAIGAGAANTAAMVAACTSGAGNSARDYRGGGLTDWFVPSKDELNALCNYSRNPASPPTGVCGGAQDATFLAGAYGFAGGGYWSSSQFDTNSAWVQDSGDGLAPTLAKNSSMRVRPIRAF